MSAGAGNSDDNGRDIGVRIRGLTFEGRDGIVFDRVNLDIPRGRVTALLGPAGAGKTALLDLVSARLVPDEGRIDVDGHDIHALKPGALRAARRRMGMLFPAPGLLEDLDLLDNVALPLRTSTDLPEPLVRETAMLQLEAAGLRAARSLKPADVSEGTARRAALARALALDPGMLLCDEPFAGQDSVTRGALARIIRGANAAHATTVIVGTRDAAAALAVADYAYVVAGGEIVGRGTPDELRATESPWVRQVVDARADGPVPFHYPGPELAEELLDGDHGRSGRA